MIGVDIEDISRFDGKDNAFYERIFTPVEIEYCSTKKNYAAHYAARFCAKEAVFKALSAAGVDNILITQIEIYNDKTGCPHVRLLNSDFNCRINISLSHEKEKAIAFAMLCFEDFEKTTYHPCYMGDEG